MIDSLHLLTNTDIQSLAKKVKDIKEVEQVSWRTLLTPSFIEQYGANGIAIIATCYDKNSIPTNPTYKNFILRASEAMYSDETRHTILVKNISDEINLYFYNISTTPANTACTSPVSANT